MSSLLPLIIASGFRTLAQQTRSETKALVAAMTVPPSTQRIILIDRLIRGLIDAGLWSKLGLFYGCAAHDEQAGRLNWKLPGTYTLTASGGPTFTAGKGFVGDGVDAYLDSGATLTALGVGQNNAHMGAYCSVDGGQQEKATIGAAGSNGSRIYPRNTANLVGTQLNDNTAGAITADGSALGHVILTRSGSTQYERYKDGATLLAASVASTGLPTGNVHLLRYSSLYTTHGIGIGHVGTALTASQAIAMQALCRTYMLGVAALARDFNTDFNADYGKL